MEEQFKHMDDLFREQLADYRETEGGTVWGQLEQRLLAHKYRKVIPGWRWYIPALLFLVLGSLLMGWDYTGNAIGLVREGGRNAYIAVSSKMDQPGTNSIAGRVQKQEPKKPGANTNKNTRTPIYTKIAAALQQGIPFAEETANVAAAPAVTIQEVLRNTDAAPTALAGRDAVRLAEGHVSPMPNSRQVDPTAALLPTLVEEFRREANELMSEVTAAGNRSVSTLNASRLDEGHGSPISNSRAIDPTAAILPAMVEEFRRDANEIMSEVKAVGYRSVILQTPNLGAGKGGTGRGDETPRPVPAAIAVAKAQPQEALPKEEQLSVHTQPVFKATIASAKLESTEVASARQAVIVNFAADANEAAPKTQRPHFISEAGLRGGIGFSPSRQQSTNIDAGYYLQRELNSHFAVIARPAIRYNRTTSRSIGSGTFYTIKSSQIDSDISRGVSGYRYVNYYFAQHYDSILVTYKVNRNNWSVDLPLLLQYRLSKQLQLQGGALLSLGPNLQVQETKEIYNQLLTDSLYAQLNAPSPKAIANQFQHSDPEYEAYTNQSALHMRWGYSLGLSYMLKSRVSIDISMRQNIGGYKDISNADVRKVYATPSVGLGISYRVSGGN